MLGARPFVSTPKRPSMLKVEYSIHDVTPIWRENLEVWTAIHRVGPDGSITVTLSICRRGGNAGGGRGYGSYMRQQQRRDIERFFATTIYVVKGSGNAARPLAHKATTLSFLEE
nr:hypothetical protein Iba_chr09dCG0720 [Ipomoea batatas]